MARVAKSLVLYDSQDEATRNKSEKEKVFVVTDIVNGQPVAAYAASTNAATVLTTYIRERTNIKVAPVERKRGGRKAGSVAKRRRSVEAVLADFVVHDDPKIREAAKQISDAYKMADREAISAADDRVVSGGVSVPLPPEIDPPLPPS